MNLRNFEKNEMLRNKGFIFPSNYFQTILKNQIKTAKLKLSAKLKRALKNKNRIKIN